MRKEHSNWDYKKDNSAYDKLDYRSRLYKGKWEKLWLKDVSTYAVKNNVSIYKAMWENCNEKNEHMPSRLFKFFPYNHNSIRCIETNAVFMNNPRNFNDPFDCMLCADEDEYIKKSLIEHLEKTEAIDRGILTEKELDKLRRSRCESREVGNVYTTFDSVVFHLCYDEEKGVMRKGDVEIRSLIRQLRAEYNCKLLQLRECVAGISSFANINEFELTTYMELWAHYAQNHEGFCVEYDLTKPINDSVNDMVMGGVLPCSYSSKPILISKQKIYKYMNNIPFKQYEQIEFDKSVILSFLRKSTAWSYEKEWRLMLPLDFCEIYGNMIPFYPIKSIYLGCKIKNDHKELIYHIAKRKGIAVYDMYLCDDKFEMNYSYMDIDSYFEDKNKCIQDELRHQGY